MKPAAPRIWQPAVAWAFAGSYVALCLLVATLAGTLDALKPRAFSELPWVPTALGTAVIVLAYGVIWPRGTFTDGRRRHWLALPFGAAWGLAQGLWFLTLWRSISAIGWPASATVLMSFGVIATYTALFQRLFWDIYVSPPHNLRLWNLRKVLLCHVPNLLCTLSYLALYDDGVVFVLWQMLALTLSAWALRMPPPWDAYRAIAGEER